MKTLWMGTELAFAVAIFGFALVLAHVPPLVRPTFGRRGEQRTRALEGSALLRLGEPLILQVAAFVARVAPRTWQSNLDDRLTRAGNWLGLTPDEFVATSLLATALGGALAAGSAAIIGVSPRWAFLGAAFLGAAPAFRVGAEAKRRTKEMNRRLPAAIDLLALCMTAGVDFPGAVRFVVGERLGRDIAREELALVLQELELGHTRAEALSLFARRVPSDAVQGFVAAVVQAEEKGNPLSESLQIQANVLRGQRSIAAEEAAARAGVLMVVPLLFLLACVLVLLLGPFILSGGIE